MVTSLSNVLLFVLQLTADLPAAPGSPQRVPLSHGLPEGTPQALAQQQPNCQPHRYEADASQSLMKNLEFHFMEHLRS